MKKFIPFIAALVVLSGCKDVCKSSVTIDASTLKDPSIEAQHGWTEQLPVSVEEFTKFMKSHKYAASPVKHDSMSAILFPIEMNEETRKKVTGGYQFSRPAEYLSLKNTCQSFMRNYIAYTDKDGLIIYIDDVYSYSGT